MTNKSPRSQNGKRPRLRLLDINFSSDVQEVPSNGRRPHGGLRGSKKHPLSPFSFNKDEKHHQEIIESIDRQFDEDFIDRHGSPAWVVDANREISHSGANPLFINRLLSPCKFENDSSFTGSRAVTPTPSGRLSGTQRSNSMYYRQTIPHQYLSATELPQVSESSLVLGRPTRTTLLRARQRCNSAPINAYQKRREVSMKLPVGNQPITREPTPTVSLSDEGETKHAFLTGARYNRARLMDVKSFNVYGVYMPRNNPLDCFMSGHGVSRLRERSEESPGAPPDTPRSDIEKTTQEQETKQKRPSTAPSKRLLSSSTPSGGRPRSARNDSTSHSVNIMKDERKGVIVTLKGFKTPPPQKKGAVLPSVTGISVPKMRYKKSRDLLEDSTIINQPPPTPVGQSSDRDGTEHVHFSEPPKTPIPEEITEEKNTQAVNKEMVNSDTHPKNLELTVKMIQLSGDPDDTAEVYDHTDTGGADDSEDIANGVLQEHNDDSNHDDNKPLDKEHPNVPSENKTKNSEIDGNELNYEEDEKNIKSNTFITDKEEIVENKNGLSLPNTRA